MRGRRPLPTSIKELTGNPGKRPLNLDEPQPPKIIPKCPKHLDENARKEWRRISLELHRLTTATSANPALVGGPGLNLLTIVDRAALAAYCQAWGRWVEAEANIQRFGAVIKTPKGLPLVNPYLRIAERAIDQMRKFLVEFGMTPSSRSRIKGSDPEGGGSSPLQKMLRARSVVRVLGS